MDFTPINTQEEFDKAIGARLERERETVRKSYADYDQIKSDLGKEQKKTGEQAKTIAELQKKIQGYETDSVKTRIALEKGIPLELRDRLTGTTEEEIRKDADSLVKFIKAKDAPPIKDNEPVETDPNKAAAKAAYRKLLNTLGGN